MIIYKITNLVNKKVYIGLTTKSMEGRWRSHVKGKKMQISKAIEKYGKENFIIEQIDQAENIEELKKKEIEWVSKEDSFKKGYNGTRGGDCSVSLHKNIIDKLSERQMGNKNSFFGKAHSKENKENWSKNRRGKNHGMYGKKQPKLTELNKNKVWTREMRDKISKANSKPIMCVENDTIYDSTVEMCRVLNLDSSSVLKVLKGKFRHHHGYTFKRID